MTFYQMVLMWVSLAGLPVLALAGFVLWYNQRQDFPSRRLLCVFRRLPWFAQFALFAFVVNLIVYGSTKTNQSDGVDSGTTNMSPLMGVMELGVVPKKGYGIVQTVSDSDIARGYRLLSVTTNATHSFEMPTNGILCGHMFDRGAYEDVALVDFGDWRFMYGSNAVNRLWAFAWGILRGEVRDVVHEIVPVGAPLSAIPSVSRLWMGVTSNDTRLVTWENFAIGRIAREDIGQSLTNVHQFLNAQIELHSGGDFITRSNGLVRMYHRIDPNDWDGDGWPNDEDPEPKCWTGGEFGLEQSLPTNANADAYFWIDVRTPYNTVVSFVGDGASNLPDPSFTARAGETNRVLLLVGKRYHAVCGQPLSVVGRSSSEVEVSGDGTEGLMVVYPVDIHALEGNDNGFRMVASPSALTGVYTWTNFCCTVSGNGTTFASTCRRGCGCGGCFVSGYFGYEGYRLPVIGGWCGCCYDESETEGDDTTEVPTAGASVVFRERILFFEDTYLNVTNEVVPWTSTTSRLVCSAYGGEHGGTVNFSITGDGALIQDDGRALPLTQRLAPHESLVFTNAYRAVRESACENEIAVAASFSESDTGWTQVSHDRATAVKIILQSEVYAPRNECRSRHKYGVGEYVQCEIRPEVSSVVFVPGRGRFIGSGPVRRYRCPLLAETNGLRFSGGGNVYIPSTLVVEPSDVYASDEFAMTNAVSIGQAGGIELCMRVSAKPFDVSFVNVMIEEIPNAGGTHTGYFADPFFMRDWLHGVGQGAGVWYNVYGDNEFMATDTVGFTRALPQLNADGSPSENGTGGWSDGVLSWMVPCGWADVSAQEGDEPLGSFANGATQVMIIDASGTCEVRKHGKYARRTVLGSVGFGSLGEE